MKAQEKTISLANQLIEQQPSLTTILPNGNAVEGIGGAYVHFSCEDFVPSEGDKTAGKFLLDLVNLQAIVHNRVIGQYLIESGIEGDGNYASVNIDLEFPTVQVPLPKNRLSKSPLENISWLGNAVMHFGKNVDLIDLSQSAALIEEQSTLATELITTSAGCIIALESPNLNITEKEQAQRSIVKRMLSAANAQALIVSRESVAILEEPATVFGDMPQLHLDHSYDIDSKRIDLVAA